MKHHFFRKGLALFSLFCIFIFHSCSEDQLAVAPEGNSNDEELQKFLSDYEVVTIDFQSILNTAKQNPTAPVDVNLNIASKPNWNFQLQTDPVGHDFVDGFKVYEVEGEDALTEHEMPINYALQGKLGNSAESSYFVLNENYLEGSILDQNTEYYLEPLLNYDKNASEDQYVLYKTDDLIPQDAGCETKIDENFKMEDAEAEVRNPDRPWHVEITMLGDYQLYRKFNNLSRAFNYLYYRLYFSNRRHINSRTSARLVVKRLYVYTSYSSRNYYPNSTSLSTSLSQITNFIDYWWYDEGDLNYFITGDNIRNPAGVAYLSTICRNPRLSFGIGIYYPAGTLANNLMAHETGHNLGMGHDASRYNIMYPSLNYNTSFTNFSKRQLTNTLNSQNSCLHR